MSDEIKAVIERAKFREAFGMQHSSQVNAFSERWEFELEEGGDIDLVAALRAVITSYERDIDGDTGLKDVKTREEIKKLQHHNAAKQIELEKLAGTRIEVDKVLPLLTRHAKSIRQAGDLVARKSTLTGEECQGVINSVVDSLERDIEQTFGRGAAG